MFENYQRVCRGDPRGRPVTQMVIHIHKTVSHEIPGVILLQRPSEKYSKASKSFFLFEQLLKEEYLLSNS